MHNLPCAPCMDLHCTMCTMHGSRWASTAISRVHSAGRRVSCRLARASGAWRGARAPNKWRDERIGISAWLQGFPCATARVSSHAGGTGAPVAPLASVHLDPRHRPFAQLVLTTKRRRRKRMPQQTARLAARRLARGLNCLPRSPRPLPRWPCSPVPCAPSGRPRDAAGLVTATLAPRVSVCLPSKHPGGSAALR